MGTGPFKTNGIGLNDAPPIAISFLEGSAKPLSTESVTTLDETVETILL